MKKKFLKKINSTITIQRNFPLSYIIPIYHCVSDEKLLHLKNIINYKNCKNFEKDLDYLLTKFEFCDWENFKIKYNKKNKKPIALLTFDDGLIEFKDNVLPILLRKGIFAINFINPAFVDNSDMMFRSKTSLLIEKINDPNYILQKSVCILLNLKKHTKSEAVSKISTINYNNKDLLNSLAELMDFDFKNYQNNHKIYMNENDLNFVKNQGFEIAAHSWDHPYFSELSLEEQLENTKKSLNFMKEKGFLNEAFAFPFTDFGVKKVFFDNLFKENQDLAFTFGTAGMKIDSFSKNLHRIAMENGFSAKEEINFENNYFQIKKIFNKNKIFRK